jgi:hypothetical protein
MLIKIFKSKICSNFFLQFCDYINESLLFLPLSPMNYEKQRKDRNVYSMSYKSKTKLSMLTEHPDRTLHNQNYHWVSSTYCSKPSVRNESPATLHQTPIAAHTHVPPRTCPPFSNFVLFPTVFSLSILHYWIAVCCSRCTVQIFFLDFFLDHD